MGKLRPKPYALAPGTHLVLGGMGHMRSPPRRLPHCHSNPLGQSAPARGWHTGKEATDTHHTLFPSLLCTELSQENPRQELNPNVLLQGCLSQGRRGESQGVPGKEAEKLVVHPTKP